MNRKYHHFAIALYLAMDALVVGGAWLLAYVFRFALQLDLGLVAFPPVPESKAEYFYLLPVVTALLLACMGHFGLYRFERSRRFIFELFDIFRAALIGWLLVLALLYVMHFFNVSRYVLVLFPVFCMIFLVASRGLARLVQAAMRRRGRGVQRAIIVGAGKLGQVLHEKVRKNEWVGIEVLSYFDGREEKIGKKISGLPVLPLADMKKFIAANSVEQVFIALPEGARDVQRDVVGALADEVVDVRVALDVHGGHALKTSVSEFCGIPILNLRESPLHGWNALKKRFFDIIISSAALLILGIPMLVIALLVKLTSKGPVFYRQGRMGLDGRQFDILKFRSMRVDAEKESGAVWAKENDPRRTRLGAFLRKTSLDELPQFINVLLGNMSVVGPRPERPVFIDDFKKQVPRYMLRHKAKAGITGWAQVKGWRGNTSLEKRIQYDLYYIENWSIWFDLKILFMTFWRGFVSKTAY